MIKIRGEQPHDREAVREVNIQAFGQAQEANIVDRLRQSCSELVSLVAVERDNVVGHVLFSPVTIESKDTVIYGMGLAPIAVLPAYQRQGIGSQLVRVGIAKLKDRHSPFIVVLGHADYYPRFGFERASSYGIRCEWDVPDEAFMILVLNKSEMHGISGVAKY